MLAVVDTSGDIVMDEDESMVMDINEAAGQSSSGLRQASLEAESETRRFNILYVPNPSHVVSSKQEVESDLTWATQEITNSQFRAIKDLTGCVNKQWANKTGLQLWLIIQMDEYDKGEAFKIDYVLWETFRDIVLDSQANPTAWNLAKKDGIIGSIDYSIDYR
ncbi:hypothetical protein EDD16DRAFT_1528357 [Pisolithus croceorrhizus]|nr:hypothetical protein EDD16DRAFT_1528357 [Pisolithus croceorrhizus]